MRPVRCAVSSKARAEAGESGDGLFDQDVEAAAPSGGSRSAEWVTVGVATTAALAVSQVVERCKHRAAIGLGRFGGASRIDVENSGEGSLSER